MKDLIGSDRTRLEVVVPTDTKELLKEIASYSKETQAEVITRLVKAEINRLSKQQN